MATVLMDGSGGQVKTQTVRVCQPTHQPPQVIPHHRQEDRLHPARVVLHPKAVPPNAVLVPTATPMVGVQKTGRFVLRVINPVVMWIGVLVTVMKTHKTAATGDHVIVILHQRHPMVVVVLVR